MIDIMSDAALYGYGASLGCQKTLKRNILRILPVRFYKYLRRLLVKTRNRKRLLQQ